MNVTKKQIATALARIEETADPKALAALRDNGLRLGVAEVTYAAESKLAQLDPVWDIKTSVEFLMEVARRGGTIGYKELLVEAHGLDPADWGGNHMQSLAGHHCGQVAFYCMDNDLPPLNVLVVTQAGPNKGHCGAGWVKPPR